MEIISLKEAKERGLKRYFTGKPCKYEHIDERKVNDRSCVTCNRIKSRKHADATKKWREENIEQDKANKREHYKNNREIYLNKAKQQRQDNPEKKKEYNTRYRHSDKGLKQSRNWIKANPEKHAKSRDNWKRANPGRVLAATRKRQCAKMQRTPAWADFQAIAEIYEESARLTQKTGIQHHVDHDIPLQGTNVSGLHIAENLVILEATDNLSKGNSFT